MVDYPMARTRLSARYWFVAAAAFVGALGTAQLGLWQLSRAAEKQALQSAIEDRARLPPLDNRALADMGQPNAQWMYRRVDLRGQWLHEHTVYLENRQMDGKPGFWVLTPLRLQGALPSVVMVQRGWVQRNFTDRTALPVLVRPDGDVQVQGRIAPPPAKLYEFETQAQGNIRQNLDLARFAQATGLPLASFSVLQTGSAGDGLSREWAPIGTGIDKHYGYAFQFFALCGLIVILFLWFQIVRRFFFIR